MLAQAMQSILQKYGREENAEAKFSINFIHLSDNHVVIIINW